ncbi:alpha/beta fold hydrolase [Kaarinaea lacus]
MRHLTLIQYLFVLVVFHVPVTHASDTAKEKRWADQIIDSLMVGSEVWLSQGDTKFLGLYTESATDEPLGGVIILHGIGIHPNWDDVIRPLRSELPERGWVTLSIQMPILDNEATAMDYRPLFPEVPGRIEAAIDFLQDKGIKNVAIVAHSLGTLMASYYLANSKQSPVNAYVGISMVENNSDDLLSNVLYLKKIKIPVYDLYGSEDQESVLKYATKRKEAATESGNKSYQQDQINGADHFYRGKQNLLNEKVHTWLVKQ